MGCSPSLGTACLELPQLPANGFKPQSKVIGHFSAREREDNIPPEGVGFAVGLRRTFQDCEQQGCDLLSRRFAPQPIACGIDGIEDAFQEGLLEFWVISQKSPNDARL